MSQKNENPIDDLFKAKLGAREFEFDEAAWSDAEKLLDSADGGSAFALWKIATIAGVLLGGLSLLTFGVNSSAETTTPDNAIQTVPVLSANESQVVTNPNTVISSNQLSDLTNTNSSPNTTNSADFSSPVNSSSQATSNDSENLALQNASLPPANQTKFKSQGRSGITAEQKSNTNSKTPEQKSSGATSSSSQSTANATSGEVSSGLSTGITAPPINPAKKPLPNPLTSNENKAGAWSPIDARPSLLRTRKGFKSDGVASPVLENREFAKPSTPGRPLYLFASVHSNRWNADQIGNINGTDASVRSKALNGIGMDLGIMFPKNKFSWGVGIGFEKLRSQLNTSAYEVSSTSIDEVINVLTDSAWTPTSINSGYYFTVHYNDTIQDTTIVINQISASTSLITRQNVYLAALVAYAKRHKNWSFSLTGGPSMRYLVQQTGTYPSSGIEPLPISNEQFRTVNLGLILRPGVHYNLTENLSIGAEFNYHASLFNSGFNSRLSSETMSSWGLGLGLRYAFR